MEQNHYNSGCILFYVWKIGMKTSVSSKLVCSNTTMTRVLSKNMKKYIQIYLDSISYRMILDITWKIVYTGSRMNKIIFINNRLRRVLTLDEIKGGLTCAIYLIFLYIYYYCVKAPFTFSIILRYIFRIRDFRFNYLD